MCRVSVVFSIIAQPLYIYSHRITTGANVLIESLLLSKWIYYVKMCVCLFLWFVSRRFH
jgi:hypothetical protein